jgi:hypothetical protein
MSTFISPPEHFLQASLAITVSSNHIVKPVMKNGYQGNPLQDQNKDKDWKILNTRMIFKNAAF